MLALARTNGLEQAVDVALGLRSAIPQNFSLDLKEIGFNGCGATNVPQQRRKPQHQLALDRSLGVVIRNDNGFEYSVVFAIFQRGNDGFGR